MERSHLKAALFPGLVVVFATYHVFSSWELPWQTRMFGLFVAIAALLFAVAAFSLASRDAADGAPSPLSVGGAAGVGILYTLALPYVGYVPATFLLIVGGIFLWGRLGIGGVKSARPIADLGRGSLVAAVFCTLTYLVFASNNIRLPAFP